jgi:hypothetical protein
MSTLANITSLNLSLQTGGAALAVNAVKSVAKPERVVYVFGTADDVAPNFTTVAGAITYANSLTPIVTEPVVIRLFTKADGTPYTLAGLSSWTTYANQYIYFVSDFVRLNETSTLPTTLPEGLTVWYRDENDVETLWVGREDGSAWPARGWKEFVFEINSGSVGFASVLIDEVFGGVYPSLDGRFSNIRSFTSSIFSGNYDIITAGKNTGASVIGVYGFTPLARVQSTTVYLTMSSFNDAGTVTQSLAKNAGFSIRVYS